MPRTGRPIHTCKRCGKTGLLHKTDPNGSKVLFDPLTGEWHGGKLTSCKKYMGEGLGSGNRDGDEGYEGGESRDETKGSSSSSTEGEEGSSEGEGDEGSEGSEEGEGSSDGEGDEGDEGEDGSGEDGEEGEGEEGEDGDGDSDGEEGEEDSDSDSDSEGDSDSDSDSEEEEDSDSEDGEDGEEGDASTEDEKEDDPITSLIRKVANEEIDKRPQHKCSGKELPTVSIKVNNKTIKLKNKHRLIPVLMDFVANREAVLLYGDSGSGKTTAAMQVAELSGLDFEYIAFCDMTQDYQILGHVDINGDFHETPLTRAFKEGKVLLLDEVDSANSNTALTLNAIIDQRRMFDVKTGEMIDANPNFAVVAAGNTGGSGATNDYAGRNQQDGAFLNRFARLPWGYDEKMERAIVRKQHENENDDLLAQIMSWVSRVQKIRKSAKLNGSPILVTPRASIKGAAMIARGANTKLINMEDVYIFGDLDEDAKAAILEGAK